MPFLYGEYVLPEPTGVMEEARIMFLLNKLKKEEERIQGIIDEEGCNSVFCVLKLYITGDIKCLSPLQ